MMIQFRIPSSFLKLKFAISFLLLTNDCNLPTTFAQPSPNDPCYVCRTPERFILDPETQFDVEVNGGTRKWTCGHLEITGIDFLTVSNGVCTTFYAYADAYCECGGPPIPPPIIIDTSPACNICDGKGIGFVPEPMIEELIDTGLAGEFPCGDLYTNAADGFLPAAFCPLLQENVGDICCNIPDIACTPGVDCPPAADGDGDDTTPTNPPTTPAPVTTPTDPPSPSPTTPAPILPQPSCGSILDSCTTNEDCCQPFICKNLRVLGSLNGQSPEMICSAPRIRQRPSVVGTGRGGQAGNAKRGFP